MGRQGWVGGCWSLTGSGTDIKDGLEGKLDAVFVLGRRASHLDILRDGCEEKLAMQEDGEMVVTGCQVSMCEDTGRDRLSRYGWLTRCQWTPAMVGRSE